eukprot:4046310-Prymnesium_polylepis.1
MANMLRMTCGMKAKLRGSQGACRATRSDAATVTLKASCAFRACEPNEMSDSVSAVGTTARLPLPSEKSDGHAQPTQPALSPPSKVLRYSASAAACGSRLPSVMALRSGVYTDMVSGPPNAPATSSARSLSSTMAPPRERERDRRP